MGDVQVADLLLDVVSRDWASQHLLPIDKSPIPNLAASQAIYPYRKLRIQIRTVKTNRPNLRDGPNPAALYNRSSTHKVDNREVRGGGWGQRIRGAFNPRMGN